MISQKVFFEKIFERVLFAPHRKAAGARVGRRDCKIQEARACTTKLHDDLVSLDIQDCLNADVAQPSVVALRKAQRTKRLDGGVDVCKQRHKGLNVREGVCRCRFSHLFC